MDLHGETTYIYRENEYEFVDFENIDSDICYEILEKQRHNTSKCTAQ